MGNKSPMTWKILRRGKTITLQTPLSEVEGLTSVQATLIILEIHRDLFKLIWSSATQQQQSAEAANAAMEGIIQKMKGKEDL